MRNRHSEDRSRSQAGQRSQPPAHAGLTDREERSKRADAGAAPGQGDDAEVEVDEDRDAVDELPSTKTRRKHDSHKHHS